MKQIFLLTLVGITLLPFWHSGLFDVHDPTSAYRLYTLVETLKSGQFPASWSNLLNFGYGYPLHLYYAPLFTYLGAIFVPIFSSYELAVKTALFVASLLGAVGVYKLVRSKAGSASSLLSAAAFIFLPYRASALYVRGSYSEFLAMSLLPWVVLYWQKPQSERKTIVTTSLLTALFILSHNTLLLIVAPVILILITVYQKDNIRGSLSSLILATSLSAWFIFPIIFERGFVQVESVATATNYHDHFLSLSQLWSSPWGYGGSGKGIEGDAMSFMIGKGQLILALIGAAFLFLKRRYKTLILYSSILVGCIFLTLESSNLIWSNLSFLRVMQFPWRSLALTGLVTSVLAGFSLEILPKWSRSVAMIILVALLVFTNYRYFKPQEYRSYNHEILSSSDNLDIIARDKIPEYLPVWMKQVLTRDGGDGLSRSSTSVYGTLEHKITSPLIIRTAYMPQWKLKINGGDYIDLIPSSEGLVMTSTDVGQGTVAVELTWHRTMIENLGIFITALGIISVVGLTLL